MNTFSMALVATFAAVTVAAPAAAQTVVHNTAPTVGWQFGSGNNYSPANTSVLTATNGDELYLRWHQTGQPAVASVNGVYNYALGTSPMSFDWGFTDADGLTGARPVGNIIVTNVGTGQSVSYNPFAGGNDNATFATGGAFTNQNSARLSFGFLFGNAFDPNVNSTYTVSLTANGNTLASTVNIGAGVPEPATWAMMMLGFGAMGAALRRRKASTATRVRFA